MWTTGVLVVLLGMLLEVAVGIIEGVSSGILSWEPNPRRGARDVLARCGCCCVDFGVVVRCQVEGVAVAEGARALLTGGRCVAVMFVVEAGLGVVVLALLGL